MSKQTLDKQHHEAIAKMVAVRSKQTMVPETTATGDSLKSMKKTIIQGVRKMKETELRELLNHMGNISVMEQNNKPKRACSAYIHFCNAKRSKLKEDNPSLPNQHVMKELSKMWKDISAQDRVPFDELSTKDKERYEKEMKAWSNIKTVVKAPRPIGEQMKDKIQELQQWYDTQIDLEAQEKEKLRKQKKNSMAELLKNMVI
tara:strand:+ start:571 stop:1176 length:606 start_codon:yes stop_codon:yes gene_type:complete